MKIAEAWEKAQAAGRDVATFARGWWADFDRVPEYHLASLVIGAALVAVIKVLSRLAA